LQNKPYAEFREAEHSLAERVPPESCVTQNDQVQDSDASKSNTKQTRSLTEPGEVKPTAIERDKIKWDNAKQTHDRIQRTEV
jgi:hypothetical protein